MTACVYLVRYLNDDGFTALAWTNRKAKDVIREIVNRHEEVLFDDLEIKEWRLGNLSQTIREELERKGITVPDGITIGANFQFTGDPGVDMLQVLLSCEWGDPVEEVQKRLKMANPLEGTPIPHSQNGAVIVEDEMQKLLAFFDEEQNVHEERK
jgi:hypothetical protein